MPDVEVKLDERELGILVNALQKAGLCKEEAELLRKLDHIYKEVLFAMAKTPPPPRPRLARVRALCLNCGLQSFLPALTKWKCPDCGNKLIRKGRAPGPQRRGTSTRSRRVGPGRGKEQRSTSDPPETQKSICASCGALHFGKCPIDHIPKKYDIVVWVEECDQWKPMREGA